MQFPTSGDDGEKCLLKCHGAWVGFSAPSVDEYSHLKAKLVDVSEELEPGVLTVSGIPPDASREALWALFERFGPESIQYNPENRSQATVILRDKRSTETVKLALDATNKQSLMGAVITVEPVKRFAGGAGGPSNPASK